MNYTSIKTTIITVLFIFILCIFVHADSKQISKSPITIQLVSPLTYQVFQRKSLYEGNIRVCGHITSDVDAIQVRITGNSLKGQLKNKWQKIPFIKSTGGFNAAIPVVPGGWYTVELQSIKNRKVVDRVSVEKVGVGEVFVGAGQSNSTSCGHDKISQTSGMVSAFKGNAWQLSTDPQPSHDSEWNNGGSFWPAFGDAMYERYHVPIGVAVTGYGGSAVAHWQENAPEGLFPWMMNRINQLGYQGFRAVLWHQGESDAQTPTEEYYQKLSAVIKQSNVAAGWDFPWFVAQASYHSPENQSWPLVREAQKKLWDTGIALEGPDTDTLGADYRDREGKGIHFNPKGLKKHGEMWTEKVGIYLDKVLGIKSK